jgi:hypothetical protein
MISRKLIGPSDPTEEILPRSPECLSHGTNTKSSLSISLKSRDEIHGAGRYITREAPARMSRPLAAIRTISAGLRAVPPSVRAGPKAAEPRQPSIPLVCQRNRNASSVTRSIRIIAATSAIVCPSSRRSCYRSRTIVSTPK